MLSFRFIVLLIVSSEMKKYRVSSGNQPSKRKKKRIVLVTLTQIEKVVEGLSKINLSKRIDLSR
jgi:hypothetical protein